MKNHQIKQFIREIKPISLEVEKEAFQKFDRLAKPARSLGRLEAITARAAGVYGTLNPDVKRKVIFLMAADHGVTAERVSAYPSEITRQMIFNFLNGGAAINVLARHFGMEVIVTDMGVRDDLKEMTGLINRKIAHGTENMAQKPAMSREMAEESILTGYQVFIQTFAEKRIDLVGLGEMGIGNTTASSAIIGLLTGEKLEDVVDMGTGLRPQEVQHKISVIKKAIALNRPDATDPLDVLRKVGGFEIGGLVGVILAAAARKIPVVMDGLISGACALLAVRLTSRVKDYLFASHRSREKGHGIALSYLGMVPIFDLQMHLGEGTGAAFGMNFIEAGFKLLNQMATLDDLKA